MIKFLHFSTSQGGIDSCIRSTENWDHLHTDINKPAKFHEILHISFRVNAQTRKVYIRQQIATTYIHVFISIKAESQPAIYYIAII